MNPQAPGQMPQVVVVGAGFGGLSFARKFPSRLAELTIIDRQNHHVFQPLLYQVATAALAAVDIAQPVRGLFGARPNLQVMMSEVTGIDLANRRVVHERGEMGYDYLVVAAGATTSYFGHDEWERHAPGLKGLDDALRIRRQILLSLERAETECDPAKREQAMTIIVVGGGPTGVELAGACAELTRCVVRKDFDHIDPRKVRVLLIQGGDRVLPTFHESLSASAQKQLEARGVEVVTGKHVEAVLPGAVVVGGQTIRADSIIWAAGVRAVPLARKLGVATDRGGRVLVNPDLSIPGHPEVFAIGDVATLKDANGVEVPGVAQAAMQMGRHVAGVIEAELRARQEGADGAHDFARTAFTFHDKGSMATIGRSAAVAEIGKMRLSGFLAWLAWGSVHLLFLIGFRNRFSVLMQWLYSYFTFKSGARIITGGPGEAPADRQLSSSPAASHETADPRPAAIH